MQRLRSTSWVVLALLAAIAGAPVDASKASPSVAGASEAPSPDHMKTEGVIVGVVTQTLEAGRYIYVEVDTGESRVWAAGPKVEVGVGDSVYFPSGMPMPDFESKSLDRKFDLLYMVDAIRVATSEVRAPESPPDEAEPESETSEVAPAEGGYTVGQIFEQRADLAGKEIDLRGRVVKFNARIMGRNWVHVQDGTKGPGGANDLVVTTSADAKVGGIVLVRGTVVTDRDFGSGYAFDVMIENASLTEQ